MYLKHIAVFSAIALLAVAVHAQDADYDYEYDADLYTEDESYLVRRADPAGVYPNAGDPKYTPRKTHPVAEDPGRFKGKSPAGVYTNAGPSGAGARPHPLPTGHGEGKGKFHMPAHYTDMNNEPGVRTRLHHPLAQGVPRGPIGPHERENADRGQP